jgi:hypothetical protein
MFKILLYITFLGIFTQGEPLDRLLYLGEIKEDNNPAKSPTTLAFTSPTVPESGTLSTFVSPTVPDSNTLSEFTSPTVPESDILADEKDVRSIDGEAEKEHLRSKLDKPSKPLQKTSSNNSKPDLMTSKSVKEQVTDPHAYKLSEEAWISDTWIFYILSFASLVGVFYLCLRKSTYNSST